LNNNFNSLLHDADLIPLKAGSLLAGSHAPAGEQKALFCWRKMARRSSQNPMPATCPPTTLRSTWRQDLVLAGRLHHHAGGSADCGNGRRLRHHPERAPHSLECLEAPRILIYR
jgi:hypothetical protein